MVECVQDCAHTGVKNLRNIVGTSYSKVFTTGVKLEVFNIFSMPNP